MSEISQEQLNELFEENLMQGLNRTKEPEKPKEPVNDFNEDAIQTLEYNTTFEKEFGCLPPSGEDFGFNKYEVQDWDPEDQTHIPAVDDTHIWDYEWLEGMLRAHRANMKVLTYGPTGSGKSTSHQQLAAHLNQPFFRINGRNDMESDTLLGKPWITEKDMIYILGDLPQKMLKGYLCLFDEPWKTPSGIQMALQRMYERDGKLQLDDMVLQQGEDFSKKIITPHPAFRLYLADNVIGVGDQLEDYSATLLQDSSTLNRIDVVLHLDYLNQDDEVQLIQRSNPGVDADRATHMVQLANFIRTNKQQGNISSVMSPRQLKTWAELAVQMRCYKKSLRMVFWNRLPSDEEKALLQNEFRTVFDLEL